MPKSHRWGDLHDMPAQPRAWSSAVALQLWNDVVSQEQHHREPADAVAGDQSINQVSVA